MRHDFTPIQTAMASLISAVNDTFAGLMATANAQREEYLDLRVRMYNTYCDINDLGQLVRTNGTTLVSLGAETLAQAAVIRECLDEGDVPTCKYEDFAGFCDGCGTTLVADEDNWSETGDGVFCDNCLDLEEAMQDEVVEVLA